MEQVFCPECDARNTLGYAFTIHGVYVWANQHGYKRRMFCHKCGCVWEKTEMPGYVAQKVVGHWATKVVNLP